MTLRRSAAGFLAGASSVLGLLFFLMLLLVGAGMAGLIRDLSLPQNAGVSFGQALLGQLGSSLAALPGYLWSARWAFILLGLLGVVLAFADVLRSRIRRPWRDHLGLVVAVGFAGCCAFWLVFSGRAAVANWLVTQPELFNERGLLLDTSWIPLLIGLLATLALAYIALATWAWWYQRWAGWLHVWRPPSVEAEAEQASARVADVYDHRPRQSTDSVGPAASPPTGDGSARRRWLLASVAGTAIGLALFMLFAAWFSSAGPAVASGEHFVNARSPSVVVALPLPRTPRQLMLSNPSGRGSVAIQLAGEGDAPALQDSFALGGTATNIVGKQIDLQGMAPGNYRLQLDLAEGQGGLVRYVALYGGGVAATFAALLASLAAGAALACAVILALELVIQGSRVSRAA